MSGLSQFNPLPPEGVVLVLGGGGVNYYCCRCCYGGCFRTYLNRDIHIYNQPGLTLCVCACVCVVWLVGWLVGLLASLLACSFECSFVVCLCYFVVQSFPSDVSVPLMTSFYQPEKQKQKTKKQDKNKKKQNQNHSH